MQAFVGLMLTALASVSSYESCLVDSKNLILMPSIPLALKLFLPPPLHDSLSSKGRDLIEPCDLELGLLTGLLSNIWAVGQCMCSHLLQKGASLMVTAEYH